MPDASRTITEQIRSRIRRDGVDLAESAGLAEKYTREELRRYSEQALAGAHPVLTDESAVERTVLATLTGYGPLQSLLDDPDVEEIWINSPTRVFVARNGISELTNIVLDDAGVRNLVERMLRSSGRRVDLSQPFVDASLPDGSRLHVAIPDVTRSHWAVNIRKFQRRTRELTQLVSLGSLSPRAAEFLRICVAVGANILVSGATAAGKTTMLNALLLATDPAERILTIEDTFELNVSARDLVALQCRPPSLEGAGEITLRRLVKEALRMRPDRIVVGEVREAESLDLLLALNAGVPGACTIHANSAREALTKLSALPLLAGGNISTDFVSSTVASCVDIVVHCGFRRGRRYVAEIAAPSGQHSGPIIEMSPLFRFERGSLEPTGGYPMRTAKFDAARVDLTAVLGTRPA